MQLNISYYTGRDMVDHDEHKSTTEKGQYSVRRKIYKPLLESTRPFIFLPFILRVKRPFSIRMRQDGNTEEHAVSKSKIWSVL